ncbi:MAG: dephospho-CoA kinase [Gemmatimonadaceae bacterium]
MLIAALTGNIASGKSTVAARFASHGARVIDADLLARIAVEPGSAALSAIVDRWGSEILTASGALDRSALRRVVFTDDREREALNAIVHPQVEALRQAHIADARRQKAQVVICDIPLLFETGMASSFEVVILVDAPRATRRERLMNDRGLDAEVAEQMIEAQMSAASNRAHADFVIENDASREALETRVDEVWRALQHRAEHSAG